MAALVERGDVLVSTVGPFARWGEPAVRGAIEAGAVYVDSTGEPPFIRRVFSEWDAPARASRATLLTAMGYDFVPGALAAALALREPGAEAAVRVDVGYYALGGGPASLSRGTRASIAGIALSPSFAFRGGAIRTVRSAERMRSFDVKGKPRPGISVGGSEHFTVPPAFPRLREVNVFLGWFGPLARGITATSRATALAGKVPGLKQAIVAGAGKLAGMGDAPAEGTTPGGLSWIAAAAYDEAGDAGRRGPPLRRGRLRLHRGHARLGGAAAGGRGHRGHGRHRAARGLRGRGARAGRRRGGHHAHGAGGRRSSRLPQNDGGPASRRPSAP